MEDEPAPGRARKTLRLDESEEDDTGGCWEEPEVERPEETETEDRSQENKQGEDSRQDETSEEGQTGEEDDEWEDLAIRALEEVEWLRDRERGERMEETRLEANDEGRTMGRDEGILIAEQRRSEEEVEDEVEEGPRYQCPLCNEEERRYIESEDLVDHLKRVHEMKERREYERENASQRRVTCDYCAREVESIGQLRDHWIVEHTGLIDMELQRQYRRVLRARRGNRAAEDVQEERTNGEVANRLVEEGQEFLRRGMQIINGRQIRVVNKTIYVWRPEEDVCSKQMEDFLLSYLEATLAAIHDGNEELQQEIRNCDIYYKKGASSELTIQGYYRTLAHGIVYGVLPVVAERFVSFLVLV